jgi:TonB family protein
MRRFLFLGLAVLLGQSACTGPARIDRNSPPAVVFPERTDLAPKLGQANDPGVHYLSSTFNGVRRVNNLLPLGSTTVYVMFIVEIDGSVSDAKVIEGSGSRALDEACLAIIRKWRLSPPTFHGKPEATAVVLPIQFQN